MLTSLLTTISLLLAQPVLPDDFIVVAHRCGVVNDELTENSLAALDEAIARGYTHVEVDLRITKDGHVVCLHDANLKRTKGVDKEMDAISTSQEPRKLARFISYNVQSLFTVAHSPAERIHG